LRKVVNSNFKLYGAESRWSRILAINSTTNISSLFASTFIRTCSTPFAAAAWRSNRQCRVHPAIRIEIGGGSPLCWNLAWRVHITPQPRVCALVLSTILFDLDFWRFLGIRIAAAKVHRLCLLVHYIMFTIHTGYYDSMHIFQSGNIGEANWPIFCLLTEVSLCHACSLSATRSLLMQNFGLYWACPSVQPTISLV
jgi:hypothetical protein